MAIFRSGSVGPIVRACCRYSRKAQLSKKRGVIAMIVATNTIRIKSGYADQVAERFKNPQGVKHAPGFVKMELLKTALDDHDELKVCTTWESREAFEGWVNSDAFKQAHAHARPGGGGAAAGSPGGSEGAAHNHPDAGKEAAAVRDPNGTEGFSHGHAHAASAAGGSGHPSSGAGAPSQPPGAGIMLGSTLSVHEVLFTTGRSD
jgi:heme oxygenase (staphylobilin-producing)